MKRSGLFLVLGSGLAVSVAGCASTGYSVRPGSERPAFNGKVLVYDQQIPPGVQHTVIGEFAEQKGWYGGTGETAREALRAAAAKGANGILIERTGHRVTSWSWASPYTEGKLLWITNYDTAAAAQGGGEVSPSRAERLRELEALHRQGLITDSEYEAKRKAIVDSL